MKGTTEDQADNDIDDLGDDPLAPFRAAFVDLARRFIRARADRGESQQTEPNEAIISAIDDASFLAEKLLWRVIELDSNVRLYADSQDICEVFVDDFKAKLHQTRDVLNGQESDGAAQRRALWKIHAESQRSSAIAGHRGKMLAVGVALLGSRFDSAWLMENGEDLGSRVLDAWPSKGGGDNARKWDLVQELLGHFGLAAASSNALKTVWKQERAAKRVRPAVAR